MTNVIEYLFISCNQEVMANLKYAIQVFICESTAWSTMLFSAKPAKFQGVPVPQQENKYFLESSSQS